MLDDIKIFLTARAPACGYFGGAEGAIRFIVLTALVCALTLAVRLMT